MTIYILHGAYGNPKENWIPWLKEELKDHNSVTPQFPTPEKQSFENWQSVMPSFTQQDIIVAHSIAVPFVLKLLETNRVKACFFISGFTQPLGNETFDLINKSFYFKPNWQIIKNHCKHFTIFHSDNDPYVPLEQAQDIAKNLGVDLTIIKGAGHFNESSGYTTFPQLLEKIKEIN